MVQTETIGPDGTRFPGVAQESFLLISDGYYSMNWAGGQAPTPFNTERFRPTDDEKLARYGVLIVNAGRLETSDGVLTIRPDFALVPEYVGGVGEFEYRLEADTLDLVWSRIDSADGVSDPSIEAGVRFHYRWVRTGRDPS